MNENSPKKDLISSQLGRSIIQNSLPEGEEIGLHTVMHIVSGSFPGQNYINVKFNIVIQNEWSLVKGNISGITHCACMSTTNDELFFNYTTNFEVKTTALYKFPCVLFTVPPDDSR